jgi:CRP/FNR family cyclic AMP-dependent transcriptional regulator
MIPTALLQQSDIFYELAPSQLDAVAGICLEKRFGFGEIIFEENSASDELYIIAHGEVEILVDPSLVGDRSLTPSRPTTIAVMRRGQSFGEIALVDQGLRSATARSAAHDTHLLIVTRSRLIPLCEGDPLLGFRLMRNLAAELAVKIRSTDLRIREELLYAQRNSRPPREGAA